MLMITDNTYMDKSFRVIDLLYCLNLVSFIFNWVGFLIAYCFTNTLSSQYGAITGFGLSLVKWAFIMKVGKHRYF